MTSQMAGKIIPSRAVQTAVEAQLDRAARDVADVRLVVGIAADDLEIVAAADDAHRQHPLSVEQLARARRSACSRSPDHPVSSFQRLDRVERAAPVERFGTIQEFREFLLHQLIAPIRPAFFDEGPQALHRIVCRHQLVGRYRRSDAVQTPRGTDSDHPARVARFDASAAGSKRSAAAGARARRPVRPRSGSSSMRSTRPIVERLFRPHAASAQTQILRRAATDSVRQEHRGDRRKHTEQDLGLAQHGVGRGEDSRLQNAASSSPPPRHWPRTAARVTTEASIMRRNRR